MEKVCSKCGEKKQEEAFAKDLRNNDGLQSRCRACNNAAAAERRKLLVRVRKKEKSSLVRKKLCATCGEEKDSSAFGKDYRNTDRLQCSCNVCNNNKRKIKIQNETREEREVRLAKHRVGTKRYRDKQRELDRKGLISVHGRTGFFIRNALRRVLVATKESKIGKTEKLLGYTQAALRARIEVNFQPGMSWMNSHAWHIDHIIPVSHFLKKGETRPHIINALCNLRPLWAPENFAKKDKLPHFLERNQHHA